MKDIPQNFTGLAVQEKNKDALIIYDAHIWLNFSVSLVNKRFVGTDILAHICLALILSF
jgi:hypothetical protein